MIGNRYLQRRALRYLPRSSIFRQLYKKTVSFTRVGTDQQKNDGVNNVEEGFTPFYPSLESYN